MGILRFHLKMFKMNGFRGLLKLRVDQLSKFLAAKAGPPPPLATYQTSSFSKITLYSIFHLNQKLKKILYYLRRHSSTDLMKCDPQKRTPFNDLFCKTVVDNNMVETLDDTCGGVYFQ